MEFSSDAVTPRENDNFSNSPDIPDVSRNNLEEFSSGVNDTTETRSADLFLENSTPNAPPSVIGYQDVV